MAGRLPTRALKKKGKGEMGGGGVGSDDAKAD